MAHKLGNGTKIETLERLAQLQQEWILNRRSPSTYCSNADHNSWVENLGELVLRLDDGTEIRRHAHLKSHTRGGTPAILHNRVIVGNPTISKGWTYYPDVDLENIVARHQNR